MAVAARGRPRELLSGEVGFLEGVTSEVFVGAFSAEGNFTTEGGGVASKVVEGEDEGVADGAVHLLDDAGEVAEGVGGELERVVGDVEGFGEGGGVGCFVGEGAEANGDGGDISAEVFDVVGEEG